jgi:hypothetical protein
MPTVAAWLNSQETSRFANWVDYVNNSPDILASFRRGDGHGATEPVFGQWHWQNFGRTETLAGARTYTPFGQVPPGSPLAGYSLQGARPLW